MTTELIATVELRLGVPDGTELGKITPGYLAAVLGDLIELEDEDVQPFAFRAITVTHIGLGAPNHPIVVLCVRDPDYSNEFTIDGGEVRIVDMDLGRSDLYEWEEFGGWAHSHILNARSLPEGSRIRAEIERIVWEKYEEGAAVTPAPGHVPFPEAHNVDELLALAETVA